MAEEAKAEPKKEAPEVKQEAPKAEKAPAKHEAHVSKFKTKVVEKFVKNIKEYPIIGAVNMEGMPAPQLQNMRKQLEGVEILMTKRRLMKIAIEQCKAEKKGIEKLEEHLKGMPALLFTKENPFALFKTLKKNKSKAPAKAGQTAPNDIEIKAGPTPFAPGPVISELGALGLKTGVEDGKVAIKEDRVVVKEGEEIQANVAGMLTRLGIEPMEIGLDLVAVYEDGVIYGKDVLDIDEEAFAADLNNAARWAFNLAVEAGVYTKDTINVMIPKAFREAKAVALEGGVINDVTKEDILGQAERQALSVKEAGNIEVGPAKAAAPKEEAKEEAEAAKPEAEAAKPEAEAAPAEKKEEAPAEKKEEAPAEKKEEAPAEKKEEAPAEKPAEQEKESAGKEGNESVTADAGKKPEATAKKVWKEVEEIQKDIKEEKKDPDLKDIKEIEEKVEKVEEEIKEIEKEEVKEEKKPEQPVLTKEEIAERAKKAEEIKKQKEISEAKRQEAEKGEKLFEQLKQEGTLRDIEKPEEKPLKTLSPQEIIEKGRKEMMAKKSKDGVPSAHELAKRK